MSEQRPDNPIKPNHYNDLSIKPIDVIESWNLSFCIGTVVKYLSRAGKKPGEGQIQDLEKAAWYLNHEIARLKGLSTWPPPQPKS